MNTGAFDFKRHGGGFDAVMKRFLWVMLLALSGCALYPRPAPRFPLLTSEACVTAPGAARDYDRPIVVALTEPVRAEAAPVAGNESERIVFGQLYETLVRVDCRGKVRPGLARDWSVSGDGREWTFYLRENARFSNGEPVRAMDIRNSWGQTRAHASRGDQLESVVPWVWIHPESVRALGDDVLLITLTEPRGKNPAVFAHPALAVTRRHSFEGWPLGSGPYIVSLDRDDQITCIPNPYSPEEQRGRTPLQIRVMAEMDPRDVLSKKPDAVLVRNKSTLDYAFLLSGYSRSLVGAERTYYLLSRNIPFPDAKQDSQYARLLNRLRRGLASEVVLSVADVPGKDYREEALWSGSFHRDDFRASGEDPPRSRPRLVYPGGDSDAVQVAERLVALATSAGDPGATWSGPVLTPAGPSPVASGAGDRLWFKRLVEAGSSWAYVVPIWSSDPSLPRDMGVYFKSSSVLHSPPREDVEMLREDSRRRLIGAAIPLLSTYSHLVIRDGLHEIIRDGIGNFHFYRAGWGESDGPLAGGKTP